MSDFEKLVLEKLDHLDERIDSLDHKIDNVEASLTQRIDTVEASLTQRIDTVEAAMAQRMDVLDHKVDMVEESLRHELRETRTLFENEFRRAVNILGDGHDLLKEKMDRIVKAQNDTEHLQLAINDVRYRMNLFEIEYPKPDRMRNYMILVDQLVHRMDRVEENLKIA